MDRTTSIWSTLQTGSKGTRKRRRAVEMNGFPLCSIDVIASKRRSNRAKDRESLPRLEDFARYLKREQPPEIEPLPPPHRGSFGPR